MGEALRIQINRRCQQNRHPRLCLVNPGDLSGLQIWDALPEERLRDLRTVVAGRAGTSERTSEGTGFAEQLPSLRRRLAMISVGSCSWCGGHSCLSEPAKGEVSGRVDELSMAANNIVADPSMNVGDGTPDRMRQREAIA